MKLKQFVKLYVGSDEPIISMTNIDDYFRALVKYGLSEIEVDKEEMMLLVAWYLHTVGNDKNGNQAKVLSEGKLDKFMGVKLTMV